MRFSAQTLATSVLLIHLAIVLFNVGGLAVIPLGGWLGWRWVRIYWWRALHLLSLAAVALQAVSGQACFLTAWQAALAGLGGGETPPMIARWINSLLYWPLPLWVFALIYVAVLLYTLALWRYVPPGRRAHIPA
ncbi:MAG TPA: DUF2784 domain-containing protein [Stellaceae bacterium]|nr:DUF2784 domain-containing protein [Stellaceae bacterium]